MCKSNPCLQTFIKSVLGEGSHKLYKACDHSSTMIQEKRNSKGCSTDTETFLSAKAVANTIKIYNVTEKIQFFSTERLFILSNNN